MTTIITPLLSIATSSTWRAEVNPNKCSKSVTSWLFDHNSLTQKLQARSKEFHVEVKQQIAVSPIEMSLSGYFTEEEKVLVREVLLYCDGHPSGFCTNRNSF